MSFEYISLITPSLLKGFIETLKLFFLTLVFALPLGLPIALAGISKFRILRMLSQTYIWIFRGTPLLLQLFFVCYGLPILFGEAFLMPHFTAAIVTFVLNYAAYFAEIYRSGIQGIDYGQREAARTLGLAPWQTLRLVVLPQAIAHIIPPVSNEVITLVKDTALATSIGVAELLKASKDANNRDVNPTAFFLAAIIYLALTFVLTVASHKLEKRFTRHERKEI